MSYLCISWGEMLSSSSSGGQVTVCDGGLKSPIPSWFSAATRNWYRDSGFKWSTTNSRSVTGASLTVSHWHSSPSITTQRCTWYPVTWASPSSAGSWYLIVQVVLRTLQTSGAAGGPGTAAKWIRQNESSVSLIRSPYVILSRNSKNTGATKLSM